MNDTGDGLPKRDQEHANGHEEGVPSPKAHPCAIRERKLDLNAYAKTLPRDYRKTFLDSQTKNRPSMAIKAKCQACCGYENLKEQVGGCRAYACPLWPYRPYQGSGDEGGSE